MLDTTLSRFRRISPRVPVYSLCSEFSGGYESHGIVVELSETGLRLQRPDTGRSLRRVQLEFELPDFDELVWADGEVCHEVVEEVAGTGDGLSGVLRSSGIRIVGMADSQRRLVREYVHFLRNESGLANDTEWCSYLPGISAPRSI